MGLPQVLAKAFVLGGIDAFGCSGQNEGFVALKTALSFERDLLQHRSILLYVHFLGQPLQIGRGHAFLKEDVPVDPGKLIGFLQRVDSSVLAELETIVPDRVVACRNIEECIRLIGVQVAVGHNLGGCTDEQVAYLASKGGEGSADDVPKNPPGGSGVESYEYGCLPFLFRCFSTQDRLLLGRRNTERACQGKGGKCCKHRSLVAYITRCVLFVAAFGKYFPPSRG